MAKQYETPEVLELGLAENLVLGIKKDLPPDNGNDGELLEVGEFVDRDE